MNSLEFSWIPFLLFAFVSCATPGPNVALLVSQGSKWGLQKTLPAIFGVSIGFPLMLLIVQLGAAEAFKLLPWLFPLLTILSLVYMLFLAIKIFKLGFTDNLTTDSRDKPIGFFTMAIFQWINGKAWQMVIMTATIYATDILRIKLLSAFSFFVILFVMCCFWVEVGKRITGFLKNSTFKKIYYPALASALIFSTFPTGLMQLQEHFQSLIFWK